MINSKKLLLITALLAFWGCQNDSLVTDSSNFSINNEVSLLDEVCSIISKAEPVIAFNLAEMAKKYGDEFETIYPNIVFSQETKAGISFESKFIEEIVSMRSQYPILSTFVNSTKSLEENTLNQLPIEFYFPNSDLFDAENEEYLTIAYPSKETEDWTDGYKYDRAGNVTYVPFIDEAYFTKNMTIVVLPADTTEYTKPLSDEEMLEYAASHSDYYTKAALANGLITSNITDSAMVSEEDILLTSVAAIRVDGTSWCGTISNKLKLAIYRASGDLVFNSDGSLKPSGSCHKPFVIPIPKKQLKNNTWIEGNYIFDDDWDLHEYDQKIFFASEHNVGNASANLTTTVGIGYKDNKPSVEMTAKADVTVSFGVHTKLRQHNQFTRAAMLAHITDNVGSGRYNGYTIYSYGIVDMVFKYYYTDIK